MNKRTELLISEFIDELPREEIVSKFGVSPDGLRGRLSEAWDNPEVVGELLKTALTGFKGQESFRLGQAEIISDSTKLFDLHKTHLAVEGGTKYAVFAGDMHLPYIRMDYFKLLLQILDEIGDEVAFFSAFNDLLDLAQYGRWGTEPHELKELFTSNIHFLFKLAEIVIKSIKRKTPNSMMLGLTGNHDKRILAHLRKVNDGYSERRVLEFMKLFYDLGVMQFSNGSKEEPILQLSDGLKWTHGVSHSSVDTTVAKNTINKCQGSLVTGDEGVFYHTVSGDIHRSFKVKYNGVTHTNSGCGCSLSPSYMTHKPIHWNLGIVIGEFDTRSRGVRNEPVDFTRKGNALVASYKGVNYEVEYDDANYFLTQKPQ